MRIAHLVCRFPPYIGGMGQVAFEQVNRLANQGHQVTVFTLQQKSKLNLSKYNFKIKYLLSFPRWGNGGFCPQLFWQLRNFDIIQLHYPFFGAQEILWLAKKLKLTQAKLVIFYHMDATFESYLLKALSLKSLLIRANLFKIAGQICCASLDYVQHSKTKKIYQRYQDKFAEIPFGSNQSPGSVKLDKLTQLKSNLKLDSKNKVILFVGGLDSAHYFKGVLVLINSLYKLKDTNIKLIIVGAGNLRSKYEQQVGKLDMIKQVVFTGYINSNKLPYYYALADVVVLPSTTPAEAFGLVLVEAKAFAKPVIGSDLPGVRDVVGKGGLIVKPGDSDDLADKLEQILSNQTLAEKFSKSAQQEVSEKYNWDKHIAKLIQIYKKIL